MKILTGDTVKILAGKDKGKQGVVKKKLIKKDKVIVEGLNMIFKHIKKKEGKPGEKIQTEMPIHISNVQVLCPKTNQGTRIKYVVSKNGEKQRISKKSGEILKNNKIKK